MLRLEEYEAKKNSPLRGSVCDCPEEISGFVVEEEVGSTCLEGEAASGTNTNTTIDFNNEVIRST